MSEDVEKKALIEALEAAGSAHHQYETAFLGGEFDEHWPGWYAAFTLGRLGDFATPSDLSSWLRDAPSGGVWAEDAATYVLERSRLK